MTLPSRNLRTRLRKHFLPLAAAALATWVAGGAARADAFPRPGDFYLISRNDSGVFVGSHKLFRDQSKGLTKVSYCRRSYFVRSHSVAWSLLEAERGNTVRIEYNFGRGWRPICENPERQVTLKDIGVSESAREVLAAEAPPSGARSRVSAIGAMFQPKSPTRGQGSYHIR